MAESNCDKDQPDLKPQGTFVCTSGVLLWGTLDNILEAKTELDNNKFDGQPTPDERRSADEHNFKCRAAKGQWIRYTTTVDGGRCRGKKGNKDNGRIGLFCHEDSMTPEQLMELGHHVNSRKLKEVMKGHAGFAWKPVDSSISKVVLTDPSWSMTVPEDYPDCVFDFDQEPGDPDPKKENCGCEECNFCCGEDDCKECEGTGRNDEKFLVDKLKAKFDKKDKAYLLKDPNDQVCGIMCEEPKEMGDMCEKDGVCARLIFNDNKELIGMKYQEMDIRSKSNDSIWEEAMCDAFEDLKYTDPEAYYNPDFLLDSDSS